MALTYLNVPQICIHVPQHQYDQQSLIMFIDQVSCYVAAVTEFQRMFCIIVIIDPEITNAFHSLCSLRMRRMSFVFPIGSTNPSTVVLQIPSC